MGILSEITPSNFKKFYREEGLRISILGMSGSGKSYLAKHMVENLMDVLRIIVIDPEGEWKALSALGDTLVIGGDEGLPLTQPLYNEYLARDTHLVFNLKDIAISSQPTYMYQILDDVFRYDMPCMVVIEEAHLVAPQNKNSVIGDTEDIQNALNLTMRLAKRGRKRGQGMILATQRPADINKSVISQTNRRFFGKIIDKSDYDAIRGYFKGTRVNLSSLSSLKNGQFYSFDGNSIMKFRTPRIRMPDLGSSTNINFEPVKSTKIEDIIDDIATLSKEIPDLEDLDEEERLRSENRYLKRKVSQLQSELQTFRSSNKDDIVRKNKQMKTKLVEMQGKIDRLKDYIVKRERKLKAIKRTIR